MFSFLTGSGTPRDAPAAAPEASTRSSARMSAVSVEGSVSQNPRRLTKRRSKGKMSISPVARAERSVRPSLRNSLVVPEETIFEEAPQSVVAIHHPDLTGSTADQGHGFALEVIEPLLAGFAGEVLLPGPHLRQTHAPLGWLQAGDGDLDQLGLASSFRDRLVARQVESHTAGVKSLTMADPRKALGPDRIGPGSAVVAADPDHPVLPSVQVPDATAERPAGACPEGLRSDRGGGEAQGHCRGRGTVSLGPSGW